MPKPEIQQALDFHAEAQELWERFYNWSQNILGPKLAASTEFSRGDLVDLGYALRCMEEMGEELRKEAKKRKDLCGKRNAYEICLSAVEKGEDPDERVHGELASGKVTLKDQPLIPKKGTAEFTQLLAYLKVDEGSVNAGLVKPDWNGMGEHVTMLRSKGLPLPPGIGQTYPDYNMSYLKKVVKVDKTDRFQPEIT